MAAGRGEDGIASGRASSLTGGCEVGGGSLDAAGRASPGADVVAPPGTPTLSPSPPPHGPPNSGRHATDNTTSPNGAAVLSTKGASAGGSARGNDISACAGASLLQRAEAAAPKAEAAAPKAEAAAPKAEAVAPKAEAAASKMAVGDAMETAVGARSGGSLGIGDGDEGGTEGVLP